MTAARHQRGDTLCTMGPVTHDALVANLLNEAGSSLISHMTTLLIGFPPQKEETQSWAPVGQVRWAGAGQGQVSEVCSYCRELGNGTSGAGGVDKGEARQGRQGLPWLDR